MKTLPSVTLANTQIRPAGSALSLMKSPPGLLLGPTAPQAAFLLVTDTNQVFVVLTAALAAYSPMQVFFSHDLQYSISYSRKEKYFPT